MRYATTFCPDTRFGPFLPAKPGASCSALPITQVPVKSFAHRAMNDSIEHITLAATDAWTRATQNTHGLWRFCGGRLAYLRLGCSQTLQRVVAISLWFYSHLSNGSSGLQTKVGESPPLRSTQCRHAKHMAALTLDHSARMSSRIVLVLSFLPNTHLRRERYGRHGTAALLRFELVVPQNHRNVRVPNPSHQLEWLGPIVSAKCHEEATERVVCRVRNLQFFRLPESL